MRDGDRRWYTVDAIGVGAFESFEKLTRIGGKALDVAPLAFGVERVQCQTGFAAATHTTARDELAVRDVEVHVLQVMDANATQLDPL